MANARNFTSSMVRPTLCTWLVSLLFAKHLLGSRALRLDLKSDDQVFLYDMDVSVPSISDSDVDNERRKCRTHSECCVRAEKACDNYCEQGSEIVDQKDASAWHVAGSCASRWQGFCTEDEDCSTPPTQSTTNPGSAENPRQICDRNLRPPDRHYKGAGTCNIDLLCNVSGCVHGTCRAGACTCNWGFDGKSCERSQRAFAFLFYGSDVGQLTLARVLVKSLRATGDWSDIVALVPRSHRGTKKGIPDNFREVLVADGVVVADVDSIPMPPGMAADPIIQKRWSGVMSKFNVFRLTAYVQVALLDLDIVANPGGDFPSTIFQECQAEVCAVRDGDPRFLNAGVIVVRPSESRFNHLMATLHNEHHHYEMPEQSFLTRYAETAGSASKLQYIDRKWNSCVDGGMLFNVGEADTGHNMLHSCSWGRKPHQIARCSGRGCNDEEQRTMVLLWQRYHAMVDPCVLDESEQSCNANALGCSWCGHYCSDVRVACSPSLLKYTNVADQDPLKNAAIGAPPMCQRGLFDTANVPAPGPGAAVGSPPSMPTFEPPMAWWAWPKAAIYQAMTDRFASEKEEPCKSLTGYCGGTFQAMQQRLPYLQNLGVDGLLMSPVVENMEGGYHGYWPKNLDAINTRMGTNSELTELVNAAQNLGFRVTADVNLNHMGIAGMMDGKTKEDISCLSPFNKPEHFHSTNCSLWSPSDFSRGRTFLESCRLYGMPDFNHENSAVRIGLQQWLRKHIDTFGFDAIRIDAAQHMSKSFLRRILRDGAPIPAFHEVPTSDMQTILEYSLAHGDFASVYNYPLYYALRDAFLPGKDGKQPHMAALAARMSSESAQEFLALNFLDNNDLPRFARMLGGDLTKYRNALACLLGAEGLPVLLYGSEQDLQSSMAASPEQASLEQVDLWRPALWEAGYSTTGTTFSLLKKLLWLRQRFHGLHRFPLSTQLSDHEWLVFSRGPATFALTNQGGGRHARSQRVLWGNSTDMCTVRLCDLLTSPERNCVLKVPGKPFKLELLEGEPKVYLPEEYLAEYEAVQAEVKEAGVPMVGHVSKPADEFTVIPIDKWLSSDGGEGSLRSTKTVEVFPRFRRSLRASGSNLLDQADLRPGGMRNADVPDYLDQWFPPLSAPPNTNTTLTIDNACFFRDSRATHFEGLVDPRGRHLLCATKFTCDLVSKKNIVDGLARSYAESIEIPSNGLPAHIFSFSSAYTGIYHLVVESLPRLLSVLPQLRAGSMQLLIYPEAAQMAMPFLARLGIPRSVVVAGGDQLAAKAYRFCPSQVHVQIYRYILNREALQELQRHMSLPWAGSNPYGGCLGQGSIVILSRGDSSRSLANEAEVVSQLESLGRPVLVVRPGPNNLEEVIDAVGKAEVIVGGHGANMLNMLFASPGTKVFEIMPVLPAGVGEFVNYHYWVMAGALDLAYQTVPAPVREDEIDYSREKTSPSEAIRSYSVDAEALKRSVAEVLDERALFCRQ